MFALGLINETKGELMDDDVALADVAQKINFFYFIFQTSWLRKATPASPVEKMSAYLSSFRRTWQIYEDGTNEHTRWQRTANEGRMPSVHISDGVAASVAEGSNWKKAWWLG